MTTRGSLRVDAATVPALVQQLNVLLQRVQDGALPLTGLKLDVGDTVAPTAAPGRGDPIVRAATIGGTVTLYYWDGAAWQAIGGGGGGGGASTADAFVTIGHPADLTAERNLAVTAGDLTLTDGGANGDATLGLAAAGTAGTYVKVTTDAKGRVTSGLTTITEAEVTNLVADLAALASASSHKGTATLSFGATGSTSAVVTVTGQTWVTGSDAVVCTVVDDARAEDAAIEGLTLTVANRVAGTGFDIYGAPALGDFMGDVTVAFVGV